MTRNVSIPSLAPSDSCFTDILTNNFKYSAMSVCLCVLQSLVPKTNIVFLIFLFFLLCSGDVETNPGPIHNYTDQKPLDILFLNIRGLRNKIEYVKDYLLDFDILSFTETKLDANVNSSSLLINGFHDPIRKDRSDSRQGGGVIIYVSQSLIFKRREDLEQNMIESIWLEINCNQLKLLICLLYKPPKVLSRDHWETFEISLDKAFDDNLPTVIGGDFNVFTVFLLYCHGTI